MGNRLNILFSKEDLQKDYRYMKQMISITNQQGNSKQNQNSMLVYPYKNGQQQKEKEEYDKCQ